MADCSFERVPCCLDSFVVVVVVSSRTDLYDDVDVFTSFSALDVVEIKVVEYGVAFICGLIAC